MPSIPQSLLWISLVVLWLFVLVPMLISKRDAVRRTSDVALATRVLNSGAGARLRRRGGPAAGHRSDPHWQPADEGEALPEETPGRSVVMVAAETRDADEPDYLDVDVVEESGALPLAEAVSAVEEPVGDVEGDHSDVDEHLDDAEELATADDDASPGEDVRAEDEYEYVDDSSGLEPPADPDLRVADSLSDSRRRRRESSTAAAVSARKYRFRARTLAVMAVLILASAVAAFTWSPSMWWACGTIAAITLLYLAYLRRQTRIEEQLRRRRAQRMARSRLGVENTSDPEFDVVPSRLRRPGAAVLEIDDEDPEFEHLDYVAFARHYDLPRAAGQ
ncbi:MAG: gephyrin-like molybdotransferase receptor GlpR [Actinomycetota bacterium]